MNYLDYIAVYLEGVDVKVVILAGGYGTRLSEETKVIPKPMVEIGGKPILWHIMKIYSHYGFNDFIICLGYKGYIIKEYFANYFLHQSDVTIDLSNNSMDIHKNSSEPWKITLVDTGLNTMTGSRLKKIEKYLGNEQFMLTYGDGVADINIKELLEFHNSHNGLVTMTSTQMANRFGILDIDNNNNVIKFNEKPIEDSGWINIGFFVCNPALLKHINNDNDTVFEKDILELITKDNKLFTYKHNGFWKCMDTLRDKMQLNDLWDNKQAKWKIWHE